MCISPQNTLVNEQSKHCEYNPPMKTDPTHCINSDTEQIRKERSQSESSEYKQS